MQKVLYKDRIEDYNDFINPDTIEYLDRHLTESFESFSEFDLMTFQWYETPSSGKIAPSIIIYIDKNDLFIFCSNEKTFEKCNALLCEDKSNEKALYLFFVALLAGEAKQLENYETVISNAEDSALRNTRRDYLNKIRDFRKELLRLKRYYEELNTITDFLTANDNEMFSKDGVRHFAIVHNRVTHFLGCVASLRDYVTQMREACQSQIEIEQNKLMKIFTVVATIFLPLTLIVGWYGMNFEYMPELSWKYGYLFVIVISVVLCICLICWFKHKRWF